MFDRYTEKARRVIFFARYEASNFGSLEIGPEHILLGLLREDPFLFQKFSSAGDDLARIIRNEVETAISPASKRTNTSIDLPLSTTAKQSLLMAADESERLNHHYIGTAHLVLGLIIEGQSPASRILNERGLSVERVVDPIAQQTAPPTDPSRIQPVGPAEVFKKLRALILLLAQRGILSPQDFPEETGHIHRLAINPQMQFPALLDILVRKGVISEDERQRLINDY